MAKKEVNPQNVTITGRLSFPTLTAEAAYNLSKTGQYPVASAAEAQPSAILMLEKIQADKLRDHILNVFLPFVEQREKDGEKRNALPAADVKKLVTATEANGSDDTFNTPFKPINEKDEENFPEAVSKVKLLGNRGVDIKEKAIVNEESELRINDGSVVLFPVILPMDQTIHEFYPGAQVAATVNLFAFKNGKLPGYKASISTLVFKSDSERIGGSVDVDEDAIFSD